MRPTSFLTPFRGSPTQRYYRDLAVAPLTISNHRPSAARGSGRGSGGHPLQAQNGLPVALATRGRLVQLRVPHLARRVLPLSHLEQARSLEASVAHLTTPTSPATRPFPRPIRRQPGPQSCLHHQRPIHSRQPGPAAGGGYAPGRAAPRHLPTRRCLRRALHAAQRGGSAPRRFVSKRRQSHRCE